MFVIYCCIHSVYVYIYVSVYVRLNFDTNSNGGKRTERENKKADIISMYN